jgi:two-component system, NtrC family, nitrogen regulation sensor histidine kinase NtrY
LKSSFLKRHLLLFLSLILFLLSFSAWYFFAVEKNQGSNTGHLKAISDNINEEIVLARQESEWLKSILEESERPLFTNLLQKTKFPYYIFRNKGIYFWSDNHLSPKYDVLKGNNAIKFVNLNNGKFMVYKNSIRKRGDIFEIYSLIPLAYEYSIDNNYVSSGLNNEIFENTLLKIHSAPGKLYSNLFTRKGQYLFSIEFLNSSELKSISTLWFVFFSAMAGIIILILYTFKLAAELKQKGRSDLSLLTLIMILTVIRVSLLLLNFPFAVIEFDLFNSKYFASSSLAPSLGDFLLNVLLVLILLWYLFRNYVEFGFVKRILKAGKLFKSISSVVITLAGSFSVFLFYFTLHTLFTHTQWSSDITVNIDFNYFRSVEILIFILAFVCFFLFNHVIYRILLNINHDKNYLIFIFCFLTGNLPFLLYSFFISNQYASLFLINVFYFLILVYLKLPKSLGRLKYLTYIYFLLTAFVCSLTGAYSIYELNNEMSLIEKQKLASQLLIDNDILGEYLLNESSAQIQNDVFIQRRLLDPFSSKEIIAQKIRRVFLINYFDKYDVDVFVFDATGNAFDKNSEFLNYQEAEEVFKDKRFKTDYPFIYFINDKTGLKRYVSFIELEKDGERIGYILIELKHKKIIPNSVYPELLVDRKFVYPIQTRNYSYGVYLGDKLYYSAGIFNYEKNFQESWLNFKDVHIDGIKRYGFSHLVLNGGGNKKVVVSSEIYSIKDIFSNFSFLYLILIFFILFFIILYAIYFRFQNINTNFSTKIQIYLNIAFFLPLLIVSVTTLSVISISYRNNLSDSFIKKAESISSNIAANLESFLKGEVKKEKLEKVLLQLARYTESDINLFSNRGRLIYTNQSMIYETGLLSKLINPVAYADIINHRFHSVMLNESVGKLKYNVAYVGIRSYETGEVIGVLSIPFFESKNEIDKQLIEVITTIINIFTTIFLVFLFLSYFASHLLTVPLRIITRKINRTSLSQDNEPIEWNSKDEIGLLVGEYNKMLIKLEESKVALAKSEKESAWREMAKQVAHEIKNPLTPMKLTIQHLQRTLKEKKKDVKAVTEKALGVLLDQVDNLSEIATSFSLFAKMPIPKYNKFDISKVLLSAVSLHNNQNEVLVEAKIEPGKFNVMGDEQLMSSIFTNLLLNSIQSVPNKRKPEIRAILSSKDSKLLIEIKDNGSGIPKNIRDKVFIPNFSTKFAGSGIGLAVAKRGVEHAGGRIWFETIEEVGTSFFIELPLYT